jgi:P27 family predicted phage terminase small subunit
MGRKPTPRRSECAVRLPAPPGELNPDARKEWFRVARRLHDEGMLTDLDRGMLAAYCQAYGRWAQAERALAEMGKLDPVTGGLMIRTKSGNAIQTPIVGTANKAMSDMARFAAELGMTPSARTRVLNAEASEKLGKKEVATEAAHTAGLGTDWGDDLTPSARIN